MSPRPARVCNTQQPQERGPLTLPQEAKGVPTKSYIKHAQTRLRIEPQPAKGSAAGPGKAGSPFLAAAGAGAPALRRLRWVRGTSPSQTCHSRDLKERQGGVSLPPQFLRASSARPKTQSNLLPFLHKNPDVC